MEHATIIGIDLAKRSFQLHGSREDGSVAFRKKLNRDKVLGFVASQPQCIVAMEACASSHHWGRKFEKLGHEVKLVPPIYVKPFVKRQKNDAADAEAICEAASRPTMRFVAVKTRSSSRKACCSAPRGPAGSPAHADDQRVARTLRGVRRRRAARACARGSVVRRD